MERKEKTENNLKENIRLFFNDYVYRTYISSAVSLFFTAVFAGYNVFLWFAYGAAWNIGIAVYYALLSGIRTYVFISENKLRKRRLTEERKDGERKKLFFVQSIFLFITDLALITPISLMVVQQKQIEYSAIPAIAVAAYTTYKIIISAVNFAKNKNRPNLSVRIFRNVNFVDALVSVLSLQYTLIMTFGDGIMGDMKILCAVSSFAIWAFLIVISAFTLAKAIKLRKE